MTGPAAATAADRREMAAALALGERARGRCAPNPAVGCLILDAAGHVAGQGWTQPGGRPHAERVALAAAGARAAGGTAYVTLEPCSHTGATPPCCDALAAAGVARVVLASCDPDPRVAGRGMARLRDAGIAVEADLLAPEARRQHAGFFLRQGLGRPAVTAKVASSLDGRIAAPTGASQWITGPAARGWGHALRAQTDAILVGAGTALADDPMLDCRLPGLAARSPVRVVLDGKLRVPASARLFASAATGPPTWLITTEGHRAAELAAYEHPGVTVLPVAADGQGRPETGAALAALAARGINDVLVEGGATLLAALLRAGTLDWLAWFAAPSVIGGDGRAAVDALGLTRPGEGPMFQWLDTTPVGPDRLARLVRRGLDEDLSACLPA